MQIAEQNIKVRGRAESLCPTPPPHHDKGRWVFAQLKASWPAENKKNHKKIEWQIVKMKTVECTRNGSKCWKTTFAR